MAESPQVAATQKSNDNASKKKKCQDQQHKFSTVCHNEEMTNAIKHSMKEAKKYFTEHNILQILTVIGQLCASYVIGSLLVQRRFTHLQAIRFLNTAIDSLLKPMKKPRASLKSRSEETVPGE